jgi:hypothetical protein
LDPSWTGPGIEALYVGGSPGKPRGVRKRMTRRSAGKNCKIGKNHVGVGRFGAALLLAAFGLALAPGCESKMEAKDCDKLRFDAFEMLNKAQHCNTDADCRQSDWPGCAKPESNATFDKIKPLSDAYKKGKCEEPKIDCKEPPPSYCKQGLCAHKEKGAPEGAGATPLQEIIIQ